MAEAWAGERQAARPELFLCEGYDPPLERRRESLFALGNGLLQVRACPPEAEPDPDGPHYAGTYRAGLYDPLAGEVADERVGHDALVNLPNWLPLAFRPADERDWVSPASAEVLDCRRELDLERGLYRRSLTYRHGPGRDGGDRRTRLVEVRLVSLAEPHLAAFQLEIRPENWSGAMLLCSALDGGVRNGNVRRYRPYDGRHLVPPRLAAPEPGLLRLDSRTLRSGVALGVAARTLLHDHGRPVAVREVERDGWRIAGHYRLRAEAGAVVTVEKTAAVMTGRDAGPDGGAGEEPGAGAAEAAGAAPRFAALREAQAEAWGRLSGRGRIEAEDGELAHALAFHRFHILQTVSPHSAGLDAGFPPRGWQEGYHGQIFWDEIFVFPFLCWRFPELARALLLYRHRRLAAARAAARDQGLRGAMFPWRSAASGREETPRFQYNLISGDWMRDDTRLQRHVGSAIAFNVWQYCLASGDEDFLAGPGAELLVEIARFWAGLAVFDAARGRYQIRGVIGPDEYHNRYPGREQGGLDNNAYTNVTAAWTLLRAADAVERLPDGRRAALAWALALDQDEPQRWREVGRRLQLCFHGKGIISQFEGFDRLAPLDRAALDEGAGPQRLDWQLEARGERVDDYQVTKQADVLMLLHLFPGEELSALLAEMGYAVDRAQLRRTADYYLRRISHESSLSRIVCAGALARLDPEASWRLFREALYPDREPPPGSRTHEGLHLGAMAATFDVVQRHYLGLRAADGAPALEPAVPPALGRVRLEVAWRGAGLELAHRDGRVALRASPANRDRLPLLVAGRRRRLAPGEALGLPARGSG